ncbi:MAG: hypothetical protein ACRYFX_12235 [Janthinobacterium lividum]
MKRIRLLRRLALGLGLLGVLSEVGARAQVAPGSRAQVSAVVTAEAAEGFRVPQVRLPNAAVARRINRQLLRYVTANFRSIDSTAAPARQLYQAARECCYDQETKGWRAGGDGLTAVSYTVLLNQDYLLSLEFSDDEGGLTQPETHHLTFDLRTGRRLTLTDLLADPPAELNRRLGWAVNRRLREELANVAAAYGDSTTIDYVAQLYGFYGRDEWNTTPRHDFTSPAVPDSLYDYDQLVKYELAEFALRPQALLLFHPVGMSRLNLEFLPSETYTFPFERLHPRGLLVLLATKAKLAKRR